MYLSHQKQSKAGKSRQKQATASKSEQKQKGQAKRASKRGKQKGQAKGASKRGKQKGQAKGASKRGKQKGQAKGASKRGKQKGQAKGASKRQAKGKQKASKRVTRGAFQGPAKMPPGTLAHNPNALQNSQGTQRNRVTSRLRDGKVQKDGSERYGGHSAAQSSCPTVAPGRQKEYDDIRPSPRIRGEPCDGRRYAAGITYDG